ncbi:MAG: alpha/beta hydrolase [Bacteroidia bacterium]
MSEIQFSHANGFPARTYEVFFEHLQPHTVSFVNIFGKNKYRPGKTWRPMVNELVESIESQHNQPVWGIGHSFGGVLTLWAAVERPELFRGIILMDPPLFPPLFRLAMGISHSLGLSEKLVPIARGAARRREKFASREEAYEYWKNKSFFRNFHPRAFEDYVQHGLAPTPEGGVELAIPRALEARLFATTPARIGNTQPGVPSYYLYATDGVLSLNQIKLQKRIFPDTTFLPVEGQHMFPLEMPDLTASIVKNIIGTM